MDISINSQAAAYATYDAVSAAYTRILTRIGVPFVKVDADSGNIGGNRSEEFHIPCSAGEDTLMSCPHCKVLFISNSFDLSSRS
jgi:prolyl-tRNA synthetase